MKTLSTKNPMLRNIIYVLIGTAFLLMIPLVAMQFTAEVNWNLFDFIVMGTLLLITGSSYVVATQNVKSANRRLLIGIVIAIIFFLIWAELAVSLFGSPFAGS